MTSLIAAAQNFIFGYSKDKDQSVTAPAPTSTPTEKTSAPSHNKPLQALPVSLVAVQQAPLAPPPIPQASFSSHNKSSQALPGPPVAAQQTAPAPLPITTVAQQKAKIPFVPLPWSSPAAQFAPVAVPLVCVQDISAPKAPNTIASTSKRKVKGAKKKKANAVVAQSPAIPSTPLPPLPPSLSDYGVPRLAQLEFLYRKYPGFRGQSYDDIHRTMASTWPSKKMMRAAQRFKLTKGPGIPTTAFIKGNVDDPTYVFIIKPTQNPPTNPPQPQFQHLEIILGFHDLFLLVNAGVGAYCQTSAPVVQTEMGQYIPVYYIWVPVPELFQLVWHFIYTSDPKVLYPPASWDIPRKFIFIKQLYDIGAQLRLWNLDFWNNIFKAWEMTRAELLVLRGEQHLLSVQKVLQFVNRNPIKFLPETPGCTGYISSTAFAPGTGPSANSRLPSRA